MLNTTLFAAPTSSSSEFPYWVLLPIFLAILLFGIVMLLVVIYTVGSCNRTRSDE